MSHSAHTYVCAGSVLEARMGALGRHVARLGSACTRHEAALSIACAVKGSHITALEESLLRLAGADDADQDAALAAVDGVREKNLLLLQVQELERDLAASTLAGEQLAETQRLLKEAQQREMAIAVAEWKSREGVAVAGGEGVAGGAGGSSREAQVKTMALPCPACAMCVDDASVHACTYICLRTHARAHAQTQTDRHTHMHTHIRKHTHTHTHTHTHMPGAGQAAADGASARAE